MRRFERSQWCEPWVWYRTLRVWWIPAEARSNGRRAMRVETRRRVPWCSRIMSTGSPPSSTMPVLDAKISPATRPLQAISQAAIAIQFERALSISDGITGAHCIHELWMRGEMSLNVERALERLWSTAATSIPEWLPMRHVEWLPLCYEVALSIRATARGRSNIYLILLDYADSRPEPHGVYVGMTHYRPAQRFDQHKAGIRAAGSVLRRGLEVLAGPTLHLQYIARAEAARIESELADALHAAGLFVQGGH